MITNHGEDIIEGSSRSHITISKPNCMLLHVQNIGCPPMKKIMSFIQMKTFNIHKQGLPKTRYLETPKLPFKVRCALWPTTFSSLIYYSWLETYSGNHEHCPNRTHGSWRIQSGRSSLSLSSFHHRTTRLGLQWCRQRVLLRHHTFLCLWSGYCKTNIMMVPGG
jgi:hypothetical protein